MAKIPAASAEKYYTKPPNLEERVIELGQNERELFVALVDLFGRKTAAEKCGLTREQLDGIIGRRKRSNNAPYESYIKACAESGTKPEDARIKVRARRPTKKELSLYYTPLTDETREDAIMAVRGATLPQAANRLAFPSGALQKLLAASNTAYMPNYLLHRIRNMEEGKNNASFGSDEHPWHSHPGYLRIGDEGRNTMRLFLMGGDINDTIELMAEIGRNCTYHHIARWFTPAAVTGYVHGLDYALMAAVVRIRMSTGYYDIISDAREFKKKPLHIRNTAARSKAISHYALAFGHNNRYEKAAETLGTDAIYLKKIAVGEIMHIPAWLYLRVLERMEKSGRILTLPAEDKELKPFIGRSDDLERRLKDYSLPAMRHGFVADIAAIGSYLEQPEQGMFELLQAVQHGYADQNTARKLRMVAEQLAESGNGASACIGALICALGSGDANREPLVRGLEYVDPEVIRLMGKAAMYIKDPVMFAVAAIAGLGSGYESERLLEGIDLFVRARSQPGAHSNHTKVTAQQKVPAQLFLSYLGLQEYAPISPAVAVSN